MKEITRINHVGLRVKNLDVTRSFYVEFSKWGAIKNCS
jgi:catechol 2,3-dioxygenase-like lactoylglutathione lyase family enzyme